MLISLIAIVLLAYALGWTPTKDSLLAVWTGIVSGVKHISFAPVSDWRAALRRVALVVGALFAIASFWTPLPAALGGSAADLRQAIIAFQIEHGLNGDGIWGPKTHDMYRKGD